jgi:hypothetical protein
MAHALPASTKPLTHGAELQTHSGSLAWMQQVHAAAAQLPPGVPVEGPQKQVPLFMAQPIHEHMQEPELGYVESAQQTVSDASTPSDPDEQGWPLPWGGFISQVHTPPAAPQASPLAHMPLCPLPPHCNGAVHVFPVQHGCPSAPQSMLQSAPPSGEHACPASMAASALPLASADPSPEASTTASTAASLLLLPSVFPSVEESPSSVPRLRGSKPQTAAHELTESATAVTASPRRRAEGHEARRLTMFPPRRGLPRSRRPPA